MECPHCRVPLAIAERQGVEVDYCPQCRGVWLDRGELDKIIERSLRQFEPAPPAAPQPRADAWGRPSDDRHKNDDHRDGHYRDGHHKDEYGHYGNKPHKRKSFLEEVFDF